MTLEGFALCYAVGELSEHMGKRPTESVLLNLSCSMPRNRGRVPRMFERRLLLQVSPLGLADLNYIGTSMISPYMRSI